MKAKKKNQVIVIGLGKFGSSVAQSLWSKGAEVLAIDEDIDKVNQAISYATHAVQMDATDEQALKTMGISNFDIACVCVSEEKASMIATLLCKEYGVEKVIAKAGNDLHAQLLNKIGADYVVFPEKDSGASLANRLMPSNAIDFIKVSPDFGMAELKVVKSWANKSLSELKFREKYGLNIVAIQHADGTYSINPWADDIVSINDAIVVLGTYEKIQDLEDAVK